MKLNNNNHLIAYIFLFVSFPFLPACNINVSSDQIDSKSQIIESSENAIETYRVSWWNLPISFGLSGNWARAIYGIISISNDELTLRHALMEGRTLDDYRLPYWPKRSFVSVSSKTAELAHQSSVTYTLNGE